MHWTVYGDLPMPTQRGSIEQDAVFLQDFYDSTGWVMNDRAASR
jgi:hypothetical protein